MAAPKAPAEEVVAIDSMELLQLTDTVQILRGRCSSKLRMEVEYMRQHGTCDNSYLIQVADACTLVDVPYEAYKDAFVAGLQSTGALPRLSHVVVTHLDPKALATLEAVLRAASAAGAQPTLVLSNPALRLLQSSWGESADKAALLSAVTLSTARSGQTLSLGPAGSDAGSSASQPVLQLELTPTPRWPDLMTAYYPADRLLFSSKLFSTHVSPPLSAVMDADVGGWEALAEDWRYFFDCMLAPSPRQASAALDKLDLVASAATQGASTQSSQPSLSAVNAGMQRLVAPIKEEFAWLRALLFGRSSPPAPAPAAPAPSGPSSSAAAAPGSDVAGPAGTPLTVAMLAPLHGPVVSAALTQLLREYRSWITEQLKAADTASVLVLYASAYGNTAALAQAISRGVTKAGVGVNTLNLELASMTEVQEALRESQGFIIGSPTLGGHMPTQVSVALGTIMREQAAKGLPCGVFGSFGWSGEAVDEMEGRLKDAGFGFAFPAIRVKFKPTAKDVLVCEDSGRDLALSIKKKARAKEAAAAPGKGAQMASGSQLAAGRLVGSLSVLTAKDDDASTAMLASWIAQASFDPPGLTVSVKKDRAMEPLMQVGNRFVISMVPEGQDKAVMRRLARPFAPGEDRLQGLDTQPGELTGAPVLKAANAYMECQVTQRMEAGDHYIVYATVLAGQVLDGNSPTAVHHRKVANHY